MDEHTMLVRLRDTDQAISPPADDLTGRTVKDKDGSKLGKPVTRTQWP